MNVIEIGETSSCFLIKLPFLKLEHHYGCENYSKSEGYLILYSLIYVEKF